jgi:hypothetical protein
MLGSLGLQCVHENWIMGEEVGQSQQIPAPEGGGI